MLPLTPPSSLLPAATGVSTLADRMSMLPLLASPAPVTREMPPPTDPAPTTVPLTTRTLPPSRGVGEGEDPAEGADGSPTLFFLPSSPPSPLAPTVRKIDPARPDDDPPVDTWTSPLRPCPAEVDPVKMDMFPDDAPDNAIAPATPAAPTAPAAMRCCDPSTGARTSPVRRVAFPLGALPYPSPLASVSAPPGDVASPPSPTPSPSPSLFAPTPPPSPVSPPRLLPAITVTPPPTLPDPPATTTPPPVPCRPASPPSNRSDPADPLPLVRSPVPRRISPLCASFEAAEEVAVPVTSKIEPLEKAATAGGGVEAVT